MSITATNPATTPPVLIGIDWGSSNLRVALIDAQGRLLARRESAAGVFTIADGRFAEALWPLCADWLAAHPVPLIACGMVGSRQGLLEVPYVACPAGLADLAPALGRARLPLPGGSLGRSPDDSPDAPVGASVTLHIVPGLLAGSADTGWDVMRGEETQLLGGLADAVVPPGAGQLTVMPGTHSKWVQRTPEGRLAGFQTYMTGELFELLCRHSSLAKVMAAAQWSPQAFALGLQQACDHQLADLLFRVRSAGLMGQLPAHALADYLSGLLIGAEVKAGLQRFGAGAAAGPVTLVGSAGLSARYSRALAAFNCSVREAPADAAFHGLLAVARAAGLVPPCAPALTPV